MTKYLGAKCPNIIDNLFIGKREKKKQLYSSFKKKIKIIYKKKKELITNEKN